ncbi:MAG: hypothetical protein AAF943_08750 [Pseudomonadota bacterium]
MGVIEENYSVKIIRSGKNNSVTTEIWTDQNGANRRPNGPYSINYDHLGRVTDENYSVWDFDPTLEGNHPSSVRYDPETGQVKRTIYLDDNGDLHRDLGRPALIHFDARTGEVVEQHFYLHGNKVDEHGKLLKDDKDPFVRPAHSPPTSEPKEP